MTFGYNKDDDNIVTVTMDMPGQSANTMNDAYLGYMRETVERLEAETVIKGVIFASAKKTFFAGGDLHSLLAVQQASEEYFHEIEESKGFLRRLEKLPVPVVAAINGAALGGGYEIALACNQRICVDDKSAVTGLPEVTLGLLPGAGGVVRTTALLGLEQALPVLLQGKAHKPEDALKLGLVDQLVETRDDLLPAAKTWIAANPDQSIQPWDRKGFAYPGGGADAPNVRTTVAVAPTLLVKKTRGLAPAPEKILDVAVNSMRIGFDSALRAETRAFCTLVASKEAKAGISTYFFGMNAIKGNAFRPTGEVWTARQSAILGAGMMGSGIAWAHASRGLPTVLKDAELEKSEKGKSYSAALCDKRIKRGQMDAAAKQQLLDRIRPTTEDDYAGVDIIIEAVFEDIALKEAVIPETFKLLGDDGIYGSNTSTLPISVLAKACPEPERFIGVHFFSPVDRMQLVEIIMGEQTSDETLRKAYDYARQIGKIPIVVNDSRGFFTSRVFSTFMDEGLALLRDGMAPTAIERAAWKIGMPVGPLAVHDEVSLVLTNRVHRTHLELDEKLGVVNGYAVDDVATRAVADNLLDQGRGGRHYGGGFYDYHADGTKTLWQGLSQFAEGNREIAMQDAEDRLIYRQAIETLRCFDGNVLRSEVEANVGSIFAIGFPSHTGGALQFIRGVGIDAFAKRAKELEESCGERFAISSAALNKLRETNQKAV